MQQNNGANVAGLLIALIPGVGEAEAAEGGVIVYRGLAEGEDISAGL